MSPQLSRSYEVRSADFVDKQRAEARELVRTFNWAGSSGSHARQFDCLGAEDLLL